MRKLLVSLPLAFLVCYCLVLAVAAIKRPSRQNLVQILRDAVPKIQVLNEMAEAGLSMSETGEGEPLQNPEAESLLFGWLVRRRRRRLVLSDAGTSLPASTPQQEADVGGPTNGDSTLWSSLRGGLATEREGERADTFHVLSRA